MEISLRHIILVCSLNLGLCGLSIAQDGGLYDNSESSTYEKPNYASGGETEPAGTSKSKNSTTPGRKDKDSVSVSTPTPRSLPEAPMEKEEVKGGREDSVLSFNFLYYIIKKYKLQDILE